MMNTIYIPSLWYQFTFIREHYTYFVGGTITRGNIEHCTADLQFDWFGFNQAIK